MSHKSNKKKAPSPGVATPVAASQPRSLRSVGPAASGGPGAPAANDFEPTMDSTPMPPWLFVVLILLVYWGMLHLDWYAGGFNPFVSGPYTSYKQLADLQPKGGAEMLIAKGEAVYGQVCVACHQGTGLGSPGQYPPLVGSEWVLGAATRLIRIPIHGLTGVIQVKGQDWNGSMPAFGGAPPLDNDENLAAVLTYIRQAWGNKAPPVTPEQVAAVRAETAARGAQWTADELQKVAE